MEIRLKSLEIEGFKSFKKRARFEFPQGDSAVMVSGKWRGSSVTSGTGKTSIMEAWAFLFDINTSSMTALKNWDSKKLFVQGTLQAGPDELVITRDPKLSLSINGVPYEGLTLGAKEKLEKILGVNPDMLKAITYRKQRVPGKLVRSTDSEIKEFLTQPLGLNEIETAAEEFTKKSNKTLGELDLIKRDISNFEMNIQMNTVTDQDVLTIQSQLEQAKLSVPTSQKAILDAESSVKIAQDALISAQETFNKANSEALVLSNNDGQREVLSQINQAKGEISKINAEISKINQLSSEIAIKRNQNTSLKESMVRLMAELEHLAKGTCPTCSREWDQVNSMKESKEKQLYSLEFSFRTNIEYIKNAEPLLNELPSLNEKLLPLNDQIQSFNKKLGEISAPLAMAQQNVRIAQQGVAAAQASVHSAQNGVIVARRGADTAVNSVMIAESNLKNLESKKRNYESLVERLNQAKDLLAAKQEEAEVDALASKLLGKSGFLGSIFDEILADIEVRANDMLRHFPNASMFTIQINSSKLVKSKGTTKKEISVSISKNGTDITMDDISGGQQSAVELCTDLAAAEAIRARSGCALKWIFLDEVMDGLGATEKEAVVNMIRQRVKGLVLMIEHATEIKESFDQTISIEYDGRESYVSAN